MQIRPLLMIIAAVVCLPLAHAQDAPKPAPASPAPQNSDAAVKTTNSTAAVADADYKIGPQDMVRVDVWKEPEITRTIPVRPDGKISLPLLNDVQASGLTAIQLSNSIHDGLTKYLNNPQVTVTVTEINSRRVYVTGEVNRPGVIPLLPDMTVLQGLSSAGGFTQFAKLKGIYVLRNESGKQTKLPFNYREVVKGKNQEQNILLLPGDVIVVP